MKRLRVAIAGLTACSGCQLTLLNCEDELPDLLELFDFNFFPMACSPALLEGEYDVALTHRGAAANRKNRAPENDRQRHPAQPPRGVPHCPADR